MVYYVGVGIFYLRGMIVRFGFVYLIWLVYCCLTTLLFTTVTLLRYADFVCVDCLYVVWFALSYIMLPWYVCLVFKCGV